MHWAIPRFTSMTPIIISSLLTTIGLPAPTRKQFPVTIATPPNGIESALLVTLNPGNYTAIVKSYSDSQQAATAGVALFEVYDLRKSASRLGNVSTRGQVGTGDNILIGGLTVGGSTPKPVVVRALGPTLTRFGVTGVLADPYLELRDGNGNLVEANNDWQQSPEAAIISADGKAPSNTKESAMCRWYYGYGPRLSLRRKCGP